MVLWTKLIMQLNTSRRSQVEVPIDGRMNFTKGKAKRRKIDGMLEI